MFSQHWPLVRAHFADIQSGKRLCTEELRSTTHRMKLRKGERGKGECNPKVPLRCSVSRSVRRVPPTYEARWNSPILAASAQVSPTRAAAWASPDKSWRATQARVVEWTFTEDASLRRLEYKHHHCDQPLARGKKEDKMDSGIASTSANHERSKPRQEARPPRRQRRRGRGRSRARAQAECMSANKRSRDTPTEPADRATSGTGT